MTELKKAVARRTAAPVDIGRRVTITLYPGDLIGFRLERQRTEFVTTIDACYKLAVRQHVAAEKRAKAAIKKAKAK